MNQFLDIAKEAYSGLETFSRLVLPPHRRVVQRMSAGPALYGPSVILLENANLAVVTDQRSKVFRDESIDASTAIFGGGGDPHRGRHTNAPPTRKLNGRPEKQYLSQPDDPS
jgi:hypothetical protein